jgi:large subunit ribosomal protein L4
MKVKVFNQKHEAVGEVTLPKEIFDTSWKADLVHQVIKAQLANRRTPVAHAKGRSEVRGGGKKPYAQKHTGRSRQGSTRSPVWVGGGKAHGPNKERDYTQKINKKMRVAALRSLLSQKLREGELQIVDSLELKNLKTKQAAMIRQNFAPKGSMLFVTSKESSSFVRAARNLPKVKIAVALDLNVYDCAAFKHIVLEQSGISQMKI